MLLDATGGRITFGDGNHGRIPPAGAPVLARYRATAADLAGFPPVLMVNSEADELRVSGEVFAATLAAASVPVEVVTEPGTEHGHLNRPDEPAASATIDRVVRWLDHLTTRTAVSTTEGTTS